MSTAPSSIPLVAHVVYRFATGGMENGLVHILNGMPRQRYRHALVCLTEAGPFAGRIDRPDVRIVELKRPPGHDVRVYGQLWSVLRSLRPAIVHTRNLAALEAQLPAALLPGTRRVHGEHGRDMFDIAGVNRKYNRLRRAVRPAIHRYIAVSRDLADWLRSVIRVPADRVRQIYNGVDTTRFRPRTGERPALAPPGFLVPESLVVGTVGRLAEVKDQGTLIDAFALSLARRPDMAPRLRLIVVGDGERRADLEQRIAARGLGHRVWLAGEREDVPEMLRLLDLFVLPSLGEGISNTLLEAMASGLPAIATRVGGNPELVVDGRTGTLVPPASPEALADAIVAFAGDATRRARCGAAARAEAVRRFSWGRCVAQYATLYDELLGRAAAPARSGLTQT